MENVKDKIAELLNKAKWTDQEKQWLLSYLENSDTKELWNLMKQKFEDENYQTEQLNKETSEAMLQNIHERIGVVKPINKVSIVKIWILRIAAASVIGILVLSIYPLFNSDTRIKIAKTKENNKPYKNNVLPGGNKAVLTLADGSTIVLDDAQNGALAKQGNTKVLKLNGKLSYNLINKDSNTVLYNTIATPRGGQYQIELPDGTHVWLNAASSLHFPTAFVEKERKVEVTGEAYFEVAKNAAMPFIVKVNEAEVQVLGTHFNIMAYNNESAIKTTLLEGKVKFVTGSFTSTLEPGQQSQLTKNGQVKVVSDVDVAEAVAWKNGIFDFEGIDIESVTRQLSRWYDVEVVYDKRINDLFYAKIPRSTKFTDVLKALELTGKVRFTIEGKKIIVTQ